MALLEVADLGVRYGPIIGTDGISFALDDGEILALVGSNGAGKSSTLKAILGMAPYPAGAISFAGAALRGCKPSEIVRHGIGYAPEGRRVFSAMSVSENLRVGGFARSAHDNAARIRRLYDYFPRLAERAGQRAGSLSGGEQQMLAIARALMPRPRLLLLDEPSLGLAPIIVERIGEILREIQVAEGLAVILAEQNANWALSLAGRAVILELGKVAATGAAADLLRRPEIRRAYLGA
ncbi:MAG TPA: ABC transporter ATP-binding protein [Stellaceae bacterium]|nr:ABC transporter ATP-binding protein [Stellaceae bacterium]